MKNHFLLVGLLAAVVFMSLSCGSTKGTINAKNSHVEKKVTIKAEEYYEYEIVLEDKMTAIGLSGEWRVNDGGDRKAKVFVMDEENFLKFKNNGQFKSYYDSGEKITHNFQIRLTNLYKSAKTLYYLILDNPSKEDDKKVEFKLDMDFEWGQGTRE
jgi:hypothetical protein